MDREERVNALNFKYPGGGFNVDGDGRPRDWKRQESEPTDEDLQAILDSAEYKNDLAEREAKIANAPIKARLAEIDLQSIRSIREWIITQPDAPERLTEYEYEAVMERRKLVLKKEAS